ncbi:universal stress protein [Sphingomicrobium astaxanthinifaciens]|uniref:universal stress protein n=1 Tax=Sphingomicrobium astaxanthinifaciens TaxID=1227949 RepID=UPI001FCA9C7C|nr:universal stress protein [Sphingomicrobium astaxanthinifaciens]MCJ7420866.1 universal stress protein [Sphingomicrobium astaxanthinifaciens]
MKTILLHVQADPMVNKRVEAALAIARAVGAHLEVLHVTSEDAAAVFQSFGGIDPDRSGQRAFDAAEKALEEAVKKELSNEDVGWDYQRVTGSTAGSIVAKAALADLIVAGRVPRNGDSKGAALTVLGDVLMNSASPVFLRGDDQDCFDPKGVAVIGWDGSFEVANAVRGGMDLIAQASEVHVVRVTERGEASENGLYPVTDVLEYLSRNGVTSEYHCIDEVDGKVSRALLDFAEDKGAGLLVVGGYGRSRLGEKLFGGTTHSLLKGCPIALMVAH